MCGGCGRERGEGEGLEHATVTTMYTCKISAWSNYTIDCSMSSTDLVF